MASGDSTTTGLHKIPVASYHTCVPCDWRKRRTSGVNSTVSTLFRETAKTFLYLILILTSAASESFSAASWTETTWFPTRKSCTNRRHSPPRLFSCSQSRPTQRDAARETKRQSGVEGQHQPSKVKRESVTPSRLEQAQV